MEERGHIGHPVTFGVVGPVSRHHGDRIVEPEGRVQSGGEFSQRAAVYRLVLRTIAITGDRVVKPPNRVDQALPHGACLHARDHCVPHVRELRGDERVEQMHGGAAVGWRDFEGRQRDGSARGRLRA